MNKFKFGDKVWHDIEPCGFGVVLAIENGECHVKFRSGTMDWFSESELTPASDWVKCSECMPEFGQSVTVYDGDRMWTDTTYDFGDGLCFYYDDDGRATHWMPLPAPPVEVVK